MSDPGAPTPPPEYTPPPTKNSGFPVKGCLIALAVAGIISLVVMGGCVVVGVQVFKSLKGPADVTNQYLKAVKVNDAADQTSLSCPGKDPKTTFAKFQIDPNSITSYDITFSFIHNGEGYTSGKIVSQGQSKLVAVHLKKYDGKWKICELIPQPDIPEASDFTTDSVSGTN